MNELPVIRNLGGCGSTLVGRLIASLPDVVLLSECNPRSAYLFKGVMNPINQLRGWFPELLPVVHGIDEYELGHPPYFGELIRKLYVYLKNNGKQLIVRDYNYVDFVGFPFTDAMYNNSSLNHACETDFIIKDVVLVRHPADQLASLRSHYCMRNLAAQDFVDCYLDFLRFFKNSYIYQYESLVSNPDFYMACLCYDIGLTWSSEAMNKFVSMDKITGNLERIDDSSISKPVRKEASLNAEKELQGCYDYNRLLEKLGY
jgi:hypothetical protein